MSLPPVPLTAIRRRIQEVLSFMPQQMGTTKTSLPQVRRFNRFLHLLIVAWTLLIIISFARSWVQHSRHAQDLARKEARSRFLMEMAYRQWVMRLGGVYVPVTPQTPPNPYLADIPYRDIRAPSGTLLTLVNSSYMTRQVSELLQASPGPGTTSPASSRSARKTLRTSGKRRR
jgi:hypothetical protein